MRTIEYYTYRIAKLMAKDPVVNKKIITKLERRIKKLKEEK